MSYEIFESGITRICTCEGTITTRTVRTASNICTRCGNNFHVSNRNTVNLDSAIVSHSRNLPIYEDIDQLRNHISTPVVITGVEKLSRRFSSLSIGVNRPPGNGPLSRSQSLESVRSLDRLNLRRNSINLDLSNDISISVDISFNRSNSEPSVFNRSSDDSRSSINEAQLTRFESRIAVNMERERGFRNMKLRAPTFSGAKSQCVKVFFSRLAKYLEHQEVRERNKVEALGLCLEGAALNAYDSMIRNNEDAEYEELRVALIARFDDNSIDIVIRSKLSNRKLKSGESIAEYYNELRTHADQIQISDQELLYIFISGLNVDMQKHLVCQNPESCEQAVSQAKALQQVSKMGQSNAIEQLKCDLKDNQVSALSSGHDADFQNSVLDFMSETVSAMRSVQDRFHNSDSYHNKPGARFQENYDRPGSNQSQRNSTQGFNDSSMASSTGPQNSRDNYNRPSDGNRNRFENHRNNYFRPFDNSRNQSDGRNNFIPNNEHNNNRYNNRYNDNNNRYNDRTTNRYDGRNQDNNYNNNYRGNNYSGNYNRYNNYNNNRGDNYNRQNRNFNNSHTRNDINTHNGGNGNSNGNNGNNNNNNSNNNSNNNINNSNNNNNNNSSNNGNNNNNTGPQNTNNGRGNVTFNRINAADAIASESSLVNNVINATSISPDMTIDCLFGGTPMNCLIDSGSSCSVISSQALNKIKKCVEILPSRFGRIIAVNKTAAAVTGSIKEILKIGDFQAEITVHILPQSNHELLVGRDFISSFIHRLNIQDNTLDFIEGEYGEKFQVKLNSVTTTDKGRPKVARAKISTKTVIKSNETIIVNMYASNEILELNLWFEPNQWTLEKGLTAKQQNVPGNTGIIKVELTNTTDHNITLFPNRNVGLLSVLDQTVSTLKPVDINDKIVHNVPVNVGKPGDRERFIEFLDSRRNVFAKDLSEIGLSKSMIHRIELSSDIPLRSRFYKTNAKSQAEIDHHIEEFLKYDLIEPSLSPYAAPVLTVPKKDGTSRFICDLRSINKITKHDSMPTPLIQDVLDSMSGAKFISTLDVISAFHQIPIYPPDREKTAIITKTGLYHWKRTCFGMRNSMASWQRLINETLRGLLYKTGACFVE